MSDGRAELKAPHVGMVRAGRRDVSPWGQGCHLGTLLWGHQLGAIFSWGLPSPSLHDGGRRGEG